MPPVRPFRKPLCLPRRQSADATPRWPTTAATQLADHACSNRVEAVPRHPPGPGGCLLQPDSARRRAGPPGAHHVIDDGVPLQAGEDRPGSFGAVQPGGRPRRVRRVEPLPPFGPRSIEAGRTRRAGG